MVTLLFLFPGSDATENGGPAFRYFFEHRCTSGYDLVVVNSSTDSDSDSSSSVDWDDKDVLFGIDKNAIIGDLSVGRRTYVIVFIVSAYDMHALVHLHVLVTAGRRSQCRMDEDSDSDDDQESDMDDIVQSESSEEEEADFFAKRTSKKKNRKKSLPRLSSGSDDDDEIEEEYE